MNKEELISKLRNKNQLSPQALNEIKMTIDNYGSSHPEYLSLINRISDLAGNSAEYGVVNTSTTQSPLANKTIAFLGSSVTFGFGSLAESFVDYLAKRDRILPIKEAVSGTTLINRDRFSKNDSYVARLEKIDPQIKLSAFVLQLSTNDARTGREKMGKISQTGNYDVLTIIGALEYILDYVKKTWNVPVFIYTNPQYQNDFYRTMVDQLPLLQQKWQFDIIDLYHAPEFNYSSEEQALYQLDEIHPTRAGYQIKWLPFFEQHLMNKI